MLSDKVIVVLLRRPQKNKSNESRTDSFWEYGSFGLTGCHRTNLMNPKKLEELRGVRLAFIQGGHSEMRLVYLTPPIATLEKHENRERTVGEVKWEVDKLPFCFNDAPLIINNHDYTDFPQIRQLIEHTDRSTPVAKFASRFRASRQPLPVAITQELIDIWAQKVAAAPPTAFAKNYWDALPYQPPCLDQNRAKTYRMLAEFDKYEPTCGEYAYEDRNDSCGC